MKENYSIQTLMILTLITFIYACGGEQDDDNSTNTPTTYNESQKSTKDSLANPNAEFKTYKEISYTVYNHSSHDITLYIYDSKNNLLLRSFLTNNSNSHITYNTSIAETYVTHTWRSRENVLSEKISIQNILPSTFTSFL